MKFRVELGVHFWMHVKTWSGLDGNALVRMAENVEAKMGPYGVTQIWLNDNLGYRSLFSMLGAIATKVELKLGTAIACQYFRHPVDLADCASTIAELCGDREFSLGVAAGNRAHLAGKVEMPKPARFLRETVQMVRALMDEQEVIMSNYPTVAEYYNIPKQGVHRIHFKPGNKNVRIYGSVNHGRQTLTHRVVAKYCDGVIVGRVHRIGDEEKILSELKTFESTRKPTRPEAATKVIQMRTSIGDDSAQAKRIGRLGNTNMFERPQEAANMFADKGLTLARIFEIREVAEKYGEEMAWQMIPDSVFAGREGISGTPTECVEKIAQFLSSAEKYGFDQVLISGGLGPDPVRALELWATEILPSL